jgi:hypothetical protein
VCEKMGARIEAEKVQGIGGMDEGAGARSENLGLDV